MPGLMSLTNRVPADVPLVFHSSRLCIPSSAVKNRKPLTGVSLGMKEMPAPALPVRISLTSTLPAAVPSLFHNSSPCTPSLATKKRVLLITAVK
jgi:hypothetical protein